MVTTTDTSSSPVEGGGAPFLPQTEPGAAATHLSMSASRISPDVTPNLSSPLSLWGSDTGLSHHRKVICFTCIKICTCLCVLISVPGPVIWPAIATDLSKTQPPPYPFHITPYSVMAWYAVCTMVFELSSPHLFRVLPIPGVIGIGIILCAASSLLGARAESVLTIASAHGVQGLAVAVTWYACNRAIGELFKDSYVLLLEAITYCTGADVAPSFIGFLASHYSWRTVFWAQVVLACLALPLAFFLPLRAPNSSLVDATFNLSNESELAANGIDWVGCFLLMGTGIGILASSGSDGVVSAQQAVFASIILLVTFCFWEAHTSSPLIPIGLFNNRARLYVSIPGSTLIYSGSSLSTAGIAGAETVVRYLMVMVMEENGHTATSTGVVISALSVVTFIGSTMAVAYRCNDKPYKLSVVTGSSVLVLVALLEASQGLGVKTLITLVGLGIGLSQNVTSAEFESSIDSKGRENGAIEILSVGLGRLTALSALGWMFNNTFEPSNLASDQQQLVVPGLEHMAALRHCYIVVAAFAGIALFGVLSMGNLLVVNRGMLLGPRELRDLGNPPAKEIPKDAKSEAS